MTQTPSRDWQKDMDRCLAVNDWHEHPWEAGSEEGSGVWKIYEIIPDEPCDFVAECETELVTDFIMTAHEALPYWLQEAKIYKQSYEGTLTAYTTVKARADAAEAREQQLRWTLERIKKITENEDQGKYYNGTIKLRNDLIDQTLSTIYPDTPASTPEIKSIRPTTAVLSEEEVQALEETASNPDKTESIGMERVREKFNDFRGRR